MHHFLNYTFQEDIALDDVLTTKSVKLTLKTPETNHDFHDWVMIEHLTTIDLVKKLDFVKSLRSDERKIFMRSVVFKCAVFESVFRAYKWKKESVVFPDGTDIFPEDIHKSLNIPSSYLNHLRCAFVAKLNELKMTDEEHLLLTSIQIADPSAHGITEESKLLISNCQKKYTSSLFEYCSLTYQKSAPSRFTDLLSLFTFINRSYEMASQLMFPYQLFQSDGQFKKLFKSSLGIDSK